MFVLCVISRSRNYQQYALICTTALFCILAATCFGSGLPSSGSFLEPSELLEIKIEWVVCHVTCGYVACVPDCCGCCAGKHNRPNHDTPAHKSRNHTLYDIPPIRFVFQVTQKDVRSSLMMAGYCRNMLESVYGIKMWYKSVHRVGHFYYADIYYCIW
jgi:hypothetical protein